MGARPIQPAVRLKLRVKVTSYLLHCTARLETVLSAGADDDLQHILNLAVKAIFASL
jgi:hypothetical protein